MTDAESLVIALEAILLGEPLVDAVTRAKEATEAARATAEAVLFSPEIHPVGADVVALYVSLVSRLDSRDYGERLAEIHNRALSTYPDLADGCLRSPEALADVEAAAGVHSTPAHSAESFATARARDAASARRRYVREIARQLARHPGHELAPAAQQLLECEKLDERIDAARRRHEEFAASEAERVTAERQRAEIAAAETRREEQERASREMRAAMAEATARDREVREARRRDRAEALAARCQAARQRATHPERLQLRAGAAISVDALIASAMTLTEFQLADYEAALAADRWTHDGPDSELWRKS